VLLFQYHFVVPIAVFDGMQCYPTVSVRALTRVTYQAIQSYFMHLPPLSNTKQTASPRLIFKTFFHESANLQKLTQN